MIRWLPLGRRLSDLNRENSQKKSPTKLETYEWYGVEVSSYEVFLNTVIWNINLFSAEKEQRFKEFVPLLGLPWYEFAASQEVAEKNMAPLIRKLFAKYGQQFEKLQRIRMFIVSLPKNSKFYTWLPTEAQIYAHLFTFLNTTLRISNKANLFPTLAIIWDGVICLEVVLPVAAVPSLEQYFAGQDGIEVLKDGGVVRFKFWLAFTREQAPKFLQQQLEHKNSNSEYSEAS